MNLKCLVFFVSLLLSFHEALCISSAFARGAQRPISKDRGSVGNFDNSGGKTEKSDEFENFPFIRSQSPIEKDKVAGMRIKDNNIVLLGYSREFSTMHLAEGEDFSDPNFFRQYPKLFSVELNGITLSDQALENLQKFLPRDLKNLIIDSCDLEADGAELVADIIKKHADSIKAITIKHIKSSTEDASKIASAISELSGLDFLSVAFREIDIDSCDHIALAIEHSEALRTLSLSWGKVTNEQQAYQKLAEEISKLRRLNSFEFSILSMSDECTKSIIDAISHLRELTNLRLYIGSLSTLNHIRLFEIAESFGDAIKHLTELKILNLSNMLLPKDPMQVIAQSLSSFKKLENLNLSGNTIDKETATLLSESFKELDNLKTLIIRNCRIDSQTFSELAKNLSNLPITTFSAGNNEIKDSIKSLPIRSMQDLQFIDFANNDVTFEALMNLLPDTIAHEKLRVIDLKNNRTLHETDNNGDINSKRDIVEKWKLRNNSNIAIFGL